MFSTDGFARFLCRAKTRALGHAKDILMPWAAEFLYEAEFEGPDGRWDTFDINSVWHAYFDGTTYKLKNEQG